MQVAFELTANPVPLEDAYRRAGLAGEKASKSNDEATRKQNERIGMLNASLARLKTSYEKTSDPKSQQGIIIAMQRLQKEIDKVKSGADKAGHSVNKALKSNTSEAGKFQNSLKGVGSMVAGAFAIGSVIQFGREVIKVQAQFDSYQRQLKAITGSETEAGRSMQFITNIAEQLGLEINSTTQAYTQFIGAYVKSGGKILEGQETFKAVSQAVTVMGLSADQTSGAFLALQQMVSKGTVQAEELRGQLGERIPGAFSIASKAMGVTEQQLGKMLEQGEVLAKDFLPRFSKELTKTFAKDSVDASKSLNAEINRLSNSWTGLMRTVGDTGIAEASIKMLTGLVNVLDASIAMATGQWGEYQTRVIQAQRAVLLDEAGQRINDQIQNRVKLLKESGLTSEEVSEELRRSYGLYADAVEQGDERIKRSQASMFGDKGITEQFVLELETKRKTRDLTLLAINDIEREVSIKGKSVELSNEELKAIESIARAREKSQKELRKWMLAPERIPERIAGVEEPEFAKGLGKGADERMEDTARLALEELQLMNIVEQGYAEMEDEKARLNKEANDKIRAQNEESMAVQLQQYEMIGRTAITLSQLQFNSLEKQGIDLEESRRNGILTEEEYQVQYKALKRKEFETNRLATLGEIAIQTALALANAKNLTTFGALSPFIIGNGLAQAVVVATRPNPYAEGTKRVKGGQLGKDSVPYIDGDGSRALLMPGEMIMPTKKVNEHAPYLDNVFDGRITATQSRWASDLFVSKRIDTGLLNFMSTLSVPGASNSGNRDIVNAIRRKEVPTFKREADRIVNAIYNTSRTDNDGGYRRWKR